MEEKCFETIEYDTGFGFNTFQREICRALGEDFWNKLTEGLTLPCMETEYKCQCGHMRLFMERFEEMAEPADVKAILMKVRHGLTVEQCAWARRQFLEFDDLDLYLEFNRQNELDMLTRLHDEGKDFYGQCITDEVLEFIKQNPAMLGPVRKGNKLYSISFPSNMEKYLNADDDTMKRYHACHCPFAKESILSDTMVSDTLCNCSLGHNLNFVEAFLDCELSGRVLTSVLKGDLLCTYEFTLPDSIVKE